LQKGFYMKIETIEALIEHQIQDLYDAENQLILTLPKVAEAVSSASLKESLEKHLEETKTHAKRLAEVAKMLEVDLEGEGCKGMEGLLEEGNEIMKSVESGPLLDSAIIGACQKVEHYEIAGYGTLIAQLEAWEKTDEAKVLKDNLADEERADEKLTQIAEEEITPEAITMSEDIDVEEDETDDA
jgi:ferritin-like metal-binding protein YciE